jgi:hypothetical protein
VNILLNYYSAIALLRPWSMELEAEHISFKKFQREYQDNKSCKYQYDSAATLPLCQRSKASQKR